MVTKLKSHCDQASMKVLQGRKTSAVVCAREDRKRKALKCAVTGYTDLTSALGDYTGFDATPQVEAFTLVAAKKNRTEARTQRKRAPELIEEEEEGARRKERRIRDSSSSSSSDDDSESELEELLRVHEEEEHALEERRTQLDEDVAVLLAEADAETERSGGSNDWQFKWGEELGQLMESYLCYEGEQTVQERTEHRTYYTSVTVRNSHTGALVLNCTTLTLALIR